jgi:hypothetical protein
MEFDYGTTTGTFGEGKRVQCTSSFGTFEQGSGQENIRKARPHVLLPTFSWKNGIALLTGA